MFSVMVLRSQFGSGLSTSVMSGASLVVRNRQIDYGWSCFATPARDETDGAEAQRDAVAKSVGCSNLVPMLPTC